MVLLSQSSRAKKPAVKQLTVLNGTILEGDRGFSPQKKVEVAAFFFGQTAGTHYTLEEYRQTNNPLTEETYNG